jgi:putative spermidine/putrescine transport system permease protein
LRLSAAARPSVGRIALNGAAALSLAFILLPLFFVTWLAFFRQEIPSFPPEGYSLKWFAAAASNKPFVDGFILSLQVGVLATLIGLALGVPASLALVRHRIPLGPALQHIAAAAAGDARHRARHLDLCLPDRDRDRDRLAGAGLARRPVAAHTLVVVPWVVRLVTASLVGFDRTIEEAAQNLGAGP